MFTARVAVLQHADRSHDHGHTIVTRLRSDDFDDYDQTWWQPNPVG